MQGYDLEFFYTLGKVNLSDRLPPQLRSDVVERKGLVKAEHKNFVQNLRVLVDATDGDIKMFYREYSRDIRYKKY